MKLFIVAALLAVASAEPDAHTVVYPGFNPLHYNQVSNWQYPVNQFLAANRYNADLVKHQVAESQVLQAQAIQRQVNGFRYKRDADSDADAEADPLVYIQQGYPFGQPVYRQQYPQQYVYRQSIAEPVFKQGTFHTALRNVVNGVRPTYSGVGQVYQPAVNRFVKRDADAEAEPESFYPGYPVLGLNGVTRYNTAWNSALYPTTQVGALNTVVSPLNQYRYNSALYPTVRRTVVYPGATYF